jgi:hypothetical protein
VYFIKKTFWQIKKKDIFCTKFGIKNVISGTIHYDRVYDARLDNDKCREKGEYYMQKYETKE